MRRARLVKILLFVAVFVFLGSLPMVERSSADVPSEEGSQYRTLQLFSDVLSIVRKSYVEDVDMKELVYGAINGMLSSLDPHSTFMPPDLYKEMKIDTRGEFGGLGIEITIRNGVLTIVSPIEDTPAYRVGLKAGDQIYKIEGKLTKDLSIMDAVKLMRGEEGTPITITVMRESFAKPREFTITREVIKIKSVKSRILDKGFGYLRIAQFQERTSADLVMALERLEEKNEEELRGLILDLRNNPGGLLDQAVKVSDIFLESGLIVYTDGRESGSKMRFTAHAEGTEPSYPMVVLINGGSASASEIVAGALQDHGRAVLMGTQSFGKGSVQTVIPLSDNSGLRLTTARYFTPNGTSIQAKGITPAIVVRPGHLEEVEEGFSLREKDLKNHIEQTDSAKGADDSDSGREKATQASLLDDYQLMRALDLLKGWEVFHSLSPKA